MADCAFVVTLTVDDVAVPVYAAASAPCSGYVVLTPAEYSALSANPFILSPEDATLVGGAIALTWATAWAIRQIGRALNTDGSSNQE